MFDRICQGKHSVLGFSLLASIWMRIQFLTSFWFFWIFYFFLISSWFGVPWACRFFFFYKSYIFFHVLFSYELFVCWLVYFAILVTESRTSQKLDKCSVIELCLLGSKLLLTWQAYFLFHLIGLNSPFIPSKKL